MPNFFYSNVYNNKRLKILNTIYIRSEKCWLLGIVWEKLNISRVLGFIYIWNKSWRRLVFLKSFLFLERKWAHNLKRIFKL